MAAAKVTYDDYAAMPDDGRRYEIIDGELCQIPTPPVRHQSVLLNLVLIIENHRRETRTGRMVLGPFDVVFSATNVVQPDMIFVSTARADVLTDDNAQGAPDIVVEVVSPFSLNDHFPIAPSKSLIPKQASVIAPRSFLPALLIDSRATFPAS